MPSSYLGAAGGGGVHGVPTTSFLCALSNALPFVHSWGAFLLSCVPQMQWVALSGGPLSAVCTSMRGSSAPPLDQRRALSLCRGMFIACRRPQSLGTPAWDLIDWLRQHTVWGDSSYASGHLRHQGTCPQFCVDGVRNHHALIWLSSLLSIRRWVDRGVHRRRGSEVPEGAPSTLGRDSFCCLLSNQAISSRSIVQYWNLQIPVELTIASPASPKAPCKISRSIL